MYTICFLYTASENEFKVFAGVAVLFRVSFIKIQTDDIFCFFAVIVQLYRIHAHCSTMIQCARRHGWMNVVIMEMRYDKTNSIQFFRMNSINEIHWYKYNI